MLPHLLVVGAKNSGDPDPAGSGRRTNGEHNGDKSGEEIGPPPLSSLSFDTNPVLRHGNSEKGIRSDGLKIQKREEEPAVELSEQRPARKGRLFGVAAVGRVRCEGSVREFAAATGVI
jgi:hypothetical protein